MDANLTTAKSVLKYLRAVLKEDPATIQNLVGYRVACNKSLAESNLVTVVEDDFNCSVGLLGLFNGFCGSYSDGSGMISAVYDDEGVLSGFRLNQPPAGDVLANDSLFRQIEIPEDGETEPVSEEFGIDPRLLP